MLSTKEILKKVRQIEIRTRGLVNHLFSGEYHSVFKGRGMAFSEVREYHFGDDIRNIDWNVTARFGSPFVKVFEEERELTVMLVVDVSGSQNFGSELRTKQQIAAEVSAVLAFSALKNNDKTGVLLFTDKVEKFIPPKKSKSHSLRIIRELLSFQPEGKKTNIKAALEYLSKTITRRAIVFIISDFEDTGYESIIKSIGKKHDCIAISIADKREVVLPKLGLISLRDPETDQEMVVDSSNPEFNRFLYKRALRKENILKQLFAAANVDHIKITTEKESYIKSLIGFFKGREKRR